MFVASGCSAFEDVMYKARLMANVYSRILGVDFTNVFSLVVKCSLIRALLVIVTKHDLELKWLDVKAIFLQEELEKDIYMLQLEGFIVTENDDCVLFEKAPLWTKVVTREGHNRYDSFMTTLDF